MTHEMTSEEKLLKLIRKKAPSSSTNKEAASQITEGEGAAKTSPIVSALKIINNGLILCVFLAAGFLIYKIFVVKSVNNEIISTEVSVVDSASDTALIIAGKELTAFEHYQAKVLERDVFQAPWEVKAENQTTQTVEPIVVVPDLNTIIKVVGLIVDDSPQAIVEDLRTNQSVFMLKGDVIADAVLDDVQEGKAIFIYNNQRVELIP